MNRCSVHCLILRLREARLSMTNAKGGVPEKVKEPLGLTQCHPQSIDLGKEP